MNDEPTIIKSLEEHLKEYGHTTVGQDIAAAILVIRELHAVNANAHSSYMIGPQTMERVFKAAGLVNMSDLQTVMDAVERALTSQGVQDVAESAKEFAASARAMKQLADHGPDDDLRDAMREMSHRMFRVLAGLSPSAIPAAPAKQDVIKPLEWDRYNGNAKWIFGTFDIQQDSDGSWMLFQFFTDENDDLKITEHPTREAAEQAAQALHNAELVKYLSG